MLYKNAYLGFDTALCSYSVICNLLTKLTYGTVQETIDDIILCYVYIFLHFYCHGMRSVMLQINEYDDDEFPVAVKS